MKVKCLVGFCSRICVSIRMVRWVYTSLPYVIIGARFTSLTWQKESITFCLFKYWIWIFLLRASYFVEARHTLCPAADYWLSIFNIAIIQNTQYIPWSIFFISTSKRRACQLDIPSGFFTKNLIHEQIKHLMDIFHFINVVISTSSSTLGRHVSLLFSSLNEC